MMWRKYSTPTEELALPRVKNGATQTSDVLKSTRGPRWPFRRSFWISEVTLRLAFLAGDALAYWLTPLTIRPVIHQWQMYGFPHKATAAQIWPEYIWLPVILVCPPAISLAALFGLNWYHRRPIRRVWIDYFLFILSHVLVIEMTVLFTEFLKSSYGGLRPDYLARCFDSNDPHEWFLRHNWTSWDEIPAVPRCTRNYRHDADLIDGRKSFPSGHASSSWASLVHLGLWLTWQLGTMPVIGSWRLAPCVACILWAVEISISRTQDYRHHLSDVIAGGIMGLSCAIFVHQYYYRWTGCLKVGDRAVYEPEYRGLYDGYVGTGSFLPTRAVAGLQPPSSLSDTKVRGKRYNHDAVQLV